MNKRELRNQQKGSLKHLKRSASEDKALLKMMTSSEAEVHQKQVHQKQPHQKLKITRSCSLSEDARLKVSKDVQWIRSRLSIAEDWKCVATVILKGFEGIGCLSSKSVDKVQLYEVYNHYLHYYAVSLLQDKKTALKYSSACNDVPSQWEWI